MVWENESQYLLKYDTRAGFKVIIDSAFKLKVKGVGFLHTQLMDDAIKVSDKNTAHDDHPFQYLSSKIDFKNSTITGPYFLDYAYWSRGHAYNPNSYLLFQVLSVPRSGKDTVQATPCGWSVCSIFDNQEYVYFGYFQLPLVSRTKDLKEIKTIG